MTPIPYRPGLPAGLALDLTALLNTSAATTLETAAISTAAQAPAVIRNRKRAAAATATAYDKLEVWYAWRPTIFATSAAGCAVALAMLWRRKKVPEAHALYSILAGISGVSAWFTRPDFLRPGTAAPEPAPSAPSEPSQAPSEPTPAQPSPMAKALAWADQDAARRDQETPGWESRTWQRLAQDMGFRTIDPRIRAVIEA